MVPRRPSRKRRTSRGRHKVRKDRCQGEHPLKREMPHVARPVKRPRFFDPQQTLRIEAARVQLACMFPPLFARHALAWAPWKAQGLDSDAIKTVASSFFNPDDPEKLPSLEEANANVFLFMSRNRYCVPGLTPL